VHLLIPVAFAFAFAQSPVGFFFLLFAKNMALLWLSFGRMHLTFFILPQIHRQARHSAV
jgi:hypothetical protein